MKKTGVKIAAKEAKKVVRAAVKQEVKKEERKVHKKGAPKPKKAMKSVISSSMRGQRTYNAPVSVGMSTRSYFQVKNLTSGKYKGGVRVMGRDYFATATWLTSSTVGSALVNVPLNPSALDGTRLAQFTALYEKYRFNKFKVYACPTASTSISGAYGMSYDRDPSDVTPATGDPGIREYMSFEGSTTASAWLQSELDAPLMEPTTDYFVNAVSGGDERLVDQGQFYLWVYTACSANTQIALEIEYDLTLYIPQTTGSVGSVLVTALTDAGSKKIPQATVGTPDAGAWNPLNSTFATANQSNWLTKLTLGDALKFVGVEGPAVDFGLQLAGGLYTLVQSYKAVTVAAPAAGVYTFDWPTFTANKAEEQSLYAAETVYVDEGAWDGTTKIMNTSTAQNLYIPPSGGVITGTWYADTAANNAVFVLSGEMNILLSPCATAVSATGLFSAMLGKPGKFGDAHRAKYRATAVPSMAIYLSEKRKAREKAKLLALPPASSVVPRDNPDATNNARAEALEAAAKLLGIK